MTDTDLPTADEITDVSTSDTSELTEAEAERRFREWEKQRDAEYRRLLDDARQVVRATRGWFGSDRDQKWLDACAKALEAQRSGRHIIEQLGAERHIDPKLMANLWAFREGLIADTGAGTAGELALVDLAVVAYANVLRVQGWVGNWSLHAEREAFGQMGLGAEFEERYGPAGERIRGLAVEQYVARISDDLLPLVERFHRMVHEALRTLRELRPVPSARVERSRPMAIKLTFVLNERPRSIK